MLDEAPRVKGVIASSAGNHAQGVALTAKKAAYYALIVMPVTTAEIKIKSVEAVGLSSFYLVIPTRETYAHALELDTQSGRVFIHPFDDPDIIAGQGRTTRFQHCLDELFPLPERNRKPGLSLVFGGYEAISMRGYPHLWFAQPKTSLFSRF
jgi:hypothetical protein